MAITRTAKGTASTKTATTVATLSSVSVNQGTTLVVAVAFDPADGNPVGQSREQDATTNPSSSTPGNAPTSTVADSISLCYYASRGPSGDTAGTAGSGHTLGKVLTPITGTAAMEQALSQIEASGGNLRELNAEEMELLELFMTGEL